MFVIVKNHLSIGLCLSFCFRLSAQFFTYLIFFFFILLVFLMGFSILRTFKNIFFGSGNSTRKGEQRRQTNSNTSGHRSTTTTARDDDDDRTPYVHRKKIFAKDEGEYVDYEEVK